MKELIIIYGSNMTVEECLAKVDTDKITHHRYGKAYNDLFSGFNREDKLNILEIGTQKGGSLQAWKEYFPNANVIGIDIVDVVPDEYRKDNVTRIISDIKDWKTDLEFDIVIDDGSHYLADLAHTISYFCVKMRKNGVIVLEDVRFPNLTFQVIENLMLEVKLAYPDLDFKGGGYNVRYWDNRQKGFESSFLIALIKYEF